MLGIFGFMSASKVPGSVPVLTFIPPYDGNYMIPFEGNFHMRDDVSDWPGRGGERGPYKNSDFLYGAGASSSARGARASRGGVGQAIKVRHSERF